MFFCVLHCFALTPAFSCTVVESFLLFYFVVLIRVFSHTCYYYYCFVTAVLLFYCIFIWQLWRHVVHYKKVLIIRLHTYTST